LVNISFLYCLIYIQVKVLHYQNADFIVTAQTAGSSGVYSMKGSESNLGKDEVFQTFFSHYWNALLIVLLPF
ncbi:hypothetical protein B296_00058156, partial [Ensete ventricosum]